MKILNRSTFARGAFAAALLGVLSAFAAGPSGLSPADVATGVAVHTSVQSEFLAKDEAARREFCASSDNLRTIRNEEAMKKIWPEAKSVYYGHPPAGTFPQGVKLSWSNGTAPYAVEVVRVRDNHVFFSQSGLTERNVTVYNFELNCSYRWTVTDNNGASASATFKTDDVYPRLLWDHDPKGRVFGLRDLGGAYVSNGAYRVKQGVLFRCSKPYSNGTDRVDNYIDTTAIRDFWLQGGMDGLGIRTELDLRGTEASAWIKKNGPFEKYVTAGISDYVINTTSGKTEAIKALKYVLDSGNYPLFFHCSIGKDRTGTIAYLAEALLGMSDDDKMRDYESSWFWYTKGSYGKIDSLLDQIRAFSGATMNDKVVTFCTKNGITMAQINAFRAAMLEPVAQGEQKLWTGKTVAVLGDSYSAFEGVPGVTRKYYPTSGTGDEYNDVKAADKMWWSRVITELDGTRGNVVAAADSRIVENREVSGGTVLSFQERLANGALGNPDVILVFGGLNDYWGMGKSSNCTAANLFAKSGELFDTLDASHPKAEKIVVLMNHPTLWNIGMTNDFRCALRQAAVDHGYTVADLDGAYANVSGDMVEAHPNSLGMQHIADRVIATLNGSYRPPVHQHQYGAWVTNVAPTTTSTGLRTRTCTAWDCTWPAAREEEVLPKQGAPVVVDPTKYGDGDLGSVTYTWKAGASGPWEYTTNWTASASPCYGIPVAGNSKAVFSSAVTEGTRVTLSESINLATLTFANTKRLALTLDNGRITLPGNVRVGCTGPVDLTFKGDSPQLVTTEEYASGRLYFGLANGGETKRANLTFVLPTEPWVDAAAPIYSPESDTPIFFSNVTFVVDAAAVSAPAAGTAVTNVLAWSEDGVRPGTALEPVLANATFRNLPAGTAAQLIKDGHAIRCVISAASEPPVVEDPKLFSWLDFGGSGSSDGAYFATDYVPDLAKTKIEMSFRMTDVTTQSSGLLYAGPDSAAAATGDKTLKTEYYYDKNGARTPWLGTTYGDESGFNDTEAFHALTLDCGACASKLDGAAVNSPKTVAAETGTTAGPLVIGAMTKGVLDYYNFAKMKLAYVRVSEKQTDGSYAVVHDWYPATNETGAAMLWDRVGKTFLEPSKKGTPEPFVSGEVVNPEEPHEHAFGEWAIVTEPTLEAAGEKRRACVCGAVESAVLPKLEKWVEVPSGFTVSNTIICLGDSLTRGEYADSLTIPATPNYFDGRMDGVTDRDNYPYRLATSIPANYNVIAQSKSGKSTDAIVSWFGGIPLKTTYKFTLPAAADELVRIPTNLLYNGTDGGWQHQKKQQSDPGSYQYYGMLTPYLPLSEPVEDGAWDNLTGWLGGVHVRFGENHATSRTVCRTEPGEPVEIPAGATFVPDAALTYRDAVKVIFAGTNDGRERADVFLQQIADAVERTGTTRYIVVSGHNMYGTTMTTKSESTYEAQFRAKFGDRHLNLRLAMVDRGVATANALGFTSVTQWNKQGAAGLLCSNDTTHYNTAGYAVVAQFVKEKLQSLGYLPADPAPTPERCDYLQTDGVGWLDLGFKPHLRNTRIEVVATVDAETSGANAMAWAHSDDQVAATHYRIGYAFWPSGDSFSYYVSTGDEKEKDYSSAFVVPADKDGIHTVYFGGTDFVVDGVRAPVDELPDDQFTGENVKLFVSRPANYQASPRIKLYSVKVWEIEGTATNLVRHFVPVRVGDGATLCDILAATPTPLAVQGTGAHFTAGDDTEVSVPTCETTFEYDGTAKRPLDDTADYTVVGDVEATIPGTYQLRVVPNGGHCWADDGSHDVRVIGWTITGSWDPVETAFGVSNKITVASQDYCILSFTNTAAEGWSWTVPTGVSEFEFLVVAGGGGGGAGQQNHEGYCRRGGGGGAGGVVTGVVANASGTFTVKVGAGGARGAAFGANGANGGDSSVVRGEENFVKAMGGGYGGGARYASTTDTGNAGGAGGSGGGGSSRNGTNTRAGGASEAPAVGAGVTAYEAFGNAGGSGTGKSGAGVGGGAGAGGADGGAGLVCAISGLPVTYACGGDIGYRGTANDGAAAAMSTGNGGAGGHGSSEGVGYYGAAGGSGIVIIRYAVPSQSVEEAIRTAVAAAKSDDSALPPGMTAGDVELAADGSSFAYAGTTFAKPHYVFAVEGERLVAKIAQAEAVIVSVSAEASETFTVGTVEESVVGFTYAVVYADDLATPPEDWTTAEETARPGTGGALTLEAPKSSVGHRFYRLRVTDR